MSLQSPLVSIIMCNYNYGRFIAEAIESVLAQTYPNFELIIVDDGSNDNSREVITSYRNSKIQTIFQENEGQAAAFNAAFMLAQGEIISFLDSDDWWKPEKLQTVARWHEFLKQDYAILQHGLEIWDQGQTRPYKIVLPVGDCFAEMQHSNRINFFVPTSGLSFPKTMLEQIFPIPTIFRIAADAYIMRTTFVFGKVYSIPDSLGYYRKHNNAVFENNDFNANAFFNEMLFPALNEFYRIKGFDYQIKQNQHATQVASARPVVTKSHKPEVPNPMLRFLSRVKHKLRI